MDGDSMRRRHKSTTPNSAAGSAGQHANTAHACRALLALCALTSSDAQATEPMTVVVLSETMVEHSTTGVAGMTTYRLMHNLQPGTQNVYAMAGTEDHPMSFPAAFQIASPFGVNVGGVNPEFYAFMPAAEFDSWITVGMSDGSNPSAISASPGFDFTTWTERAALGPLYDAAIFWMDPDSGPGGADPIVMGQLTVPSGSAPTAMATLQGRSVNTGAAR